MRTVVLLLLLTANLTADAVQSVVAALRDGRPQQALAALEPLLKRSPRDAQLLTLRGIALKQTGETDAALRSFRAALRSQPRYVAALQGAAEIEYNTGKPEALERLRSLVELAPSLPAAHAMLGVLYFEQADYAAAIRHFEGAELDRNPMAQWQYGQALYALTRYEDAAAVFSKLEGTAREARLNVALCRFEQGRYADAAAALAPLLEAEKPAIETLRLAASAHSGQKNPAEAIRLMQRAASLYPRDERVYLDLANLCLDHTAYDLGIEIIGVAMKNVQPTARLHAMRAILFVQSGRMESAEADFEAARQISTDSSYGQVGLGITLMQTERLDDSIRLLRSQLAVKPQDVTISFVLAQALMKKGQGPDTPEYKEAQKLLERVTRMNPRHAQAHALLGKIYLSGERPGDAIPLLERAIALDPADRTATYQLMVAYGRTGQPERSAAMQQRVREVMDQERKDEVERNRIHLVKAPERPKQ